MPSDQLKRGLKERHIQLIALGGSIGVGLFLGSAAAINIAGPAILAAYLASGILVFYLLRALGELAVAYPVAGSFSAYANNLFGPMAGYITGWTYWFMWIVTCIAEITAIGVYMNYWLPELPQWIPALATVIIIACVNTITVEAYGEVEFWLSIIKVITIIALLVLGVGIILFGIGNNGLASGIGNLYRHGGFFPNGMMGAVQALPLAMFAYVGVEIIGVTAGEAKHPEKVLPSAINNFFWRILLFYIGSLYVILALYPWNEIGAMESPFVSVLEKTGFRYAAAFMNFVILSAAVSSFNSGIFSTGRMLYSLAENKCAPSILAKVNKYQAPVNAVIVSTVCLMVGVLLNYFIPSKVFIYVTGVSAFAGLWIWGAIFLIQLKFRRGLTKTQASRLTYPMPGYPVSGVLCLLGLILTAAAMSLNPDTRLALIVGPIWLILLTASYFMCYNKRKN